MQKLPNSLASRFCASLPPVAFPSNNKNALDCVVSGLSSPLCPIRRYTHEHNPHNTQLANSSDCNTGLQTQFWLMVARQSCAQCTFVAAIAVGMEAHQGGQACHKNHSQAAQRIQSAWNGMHLQQNCAIWRKHCTDMIADRIAEAHPFSDEVPSWDPLQLGPESDIEFGRPLLDLDLIILRRKPHGDLQSQRHEMVLCGCAQMDELQSFWASCLQLAGL